MTETNELDQLVGQASGLLETVAELKSDESTSWAYIVTRQLKLPINEGFATLYVYMMGKIRIAEVKKTEESAKDLKTLISAGETALFLVTNIRQMFDLNTLNHDGFADWEDEYMRYRSNSIQNRVNRILYHMASNKTPK